MFSQAALDKRLKQSLPPGDDNAVVFDHDMHDSAIAVHVVKQTKHGKWTVAGIYDHDWDTHDDTLAGQVIYSWKR